MRTAFILRGLPASGKSSFASELVRKEPKRFVRINRDDLRAMVAGPGNNPHQGSLAREDLIRSFKETLIKQAFKDGFDVILDDTHLVKNTVNKFHKLFESIGDVKVIEKAFNVSIEECIARDAKRTGFAQVGEKIITGMAKGAGLDRKGTLRDKEVYYAPRATSSGIAPVYDPKLPDVILCDLDGTLAIIGDRTPYDATDCDVKDFPNQPVIDCVMAMYAKGVRVIFMSGRDVKYRPETERFIEKYCRVPQTIKTIAGTNEYELDTNIVSPDRPIAYELHMRGESDLEKTDQRKDSIIKQELYEQHVLGKFNVKFVLDDRNQVVSLWRELGLTCFQVNYGNF
jgi:predicted kinase